MVAWQPVVESVNVNVTDPTVSGVITPELSIVAIDGSFETHVPPERGVSWTLLPRQTVFGPPKTGTSLTTTSAWTKSVHPLTVTVYWIVAVPAESPVTFPDESTLAIAGVAVDQTPPGVKLESAVELPTHTARVPVIGLTMGIGLTVKFEADVPVPLAVVTLIGPVVAATGEVTVICVAVFDTIDAGTPLKLTLVALERLVPFIVTVVVDP